MTLQKSCGAERVKDEIFAKQCMNIFVNDEVFVKHSYEISICLYRPTLAVSPSLGGSRQHKRNSKNNGDFTPFF